MEIFENPEKKKLTNETLDVTDNLSIFSNFNKFFKAKNAIFLILLPFKFQ